MWKKTTIFNQILSKWGVKLLIKKENWNPNFRPNSIIISKAPFDQYFF